MKFAFVAKHRGIWPPLVVAFATTAGQGVGMGMQSAGCFNVRLS